MHNLIYFIKEAFINLKRNTSTAVGSIITIFLSLFLIGIFCFMNIMVQSIADDMEDKVSITAYVSDDASDEDIETVMADIAEMEYVDTVSFTTKEQALEEFQESEANLDMVEALDGENPLPRSIEVELTDSQMVETVVDQILANETFVNICDDPDDPTDSVMYGQRSVERLLTVTNIIRYAGIAVVILLVFVTLVFISNTIRLAITARRREISIMRLVGATKGFIRGPFIMEGVLHALIGSLLAILCLYAVRMALMPQLSTLIQWLPVNITTMEFVGVSVMLVVIGVLIGLFGSALAMRRYLKV